MNRLAIAPTTLPDTPPVTFLEAAAEAGYDGVGLRLNPSPGLPFHPVVGNPALMQEVRRAVASTGLSVIDILSFYLTPESRLDDFRPAIEFGAELGGRYLLVMGQDDDWQRLTDSFAAICDAAAEAGMRCSLEFAVTRPLATARQSKRLIEDAGREAFICIDPLNLVRAGEGADDLKAIGGRYFPYAQLTDGYLEPGEPDVSKLGRMSPNRRSMVGEGDLPVAAILDALPPGIPLSVETPIAIEPGLDGRDRDVARAWAKRTLDNACRFLAGYYEDRQKGVPA